MTREDKIKIAIEKGYTCNPETGEVFGIRGGVIKRKHSGYIRMCIRNNSDKIYIHTHQFIWYWVNKEVVDHIDHINGIKDDNRIDNLRSVTNQQNHFNRIKVKGYTFYKPTKKWKSYIKISGKLIHLGYFQTEEEARESYLKAKKIYHII